MPKKKHIFFVGVLLLIVAAVCGITNANALLAADAKATKIVVEKHHHRMTLYENNNVLRVYRVALGRGDSSAKQYEGDNRTPEGWYVIDGKNNTSQFYKSLHISYPSPQDVVRAKTQSRSPGGAVLIHGLRNDLGWIGRLHVLKDWTRGCIGVTNDELDEIWRLVHVGTPIEIRQ